MIHLIAQRIAPAFVALFISMHPATAGVEVQEITTKTGINAWLVEEHSIPFVALELRFRGGTSLDRVGKRGEVNLMMALLEEGAGELDSQAFSNARDNLAASYDFGAYQDLVSISSRFLTENRDEAITLLKQALSETRFDQVALDRVRGQVMTVINAAETDTGDLASDRFNTLVFGDHPYGTSDNGTRDSINDLTREDMFAARDRVMVKDRVYVSAVGDISADELSGLLDSLFANLPESGPELPDRIEPNLTGEITVIAYDTPQSTIVFGQSGITRDDPDFIPAFMANEIFGGLSDSRLMQEVREKRGLTYGIGTYLLPFSHSELVMGQFSTRNDAVKQAIDVVKSEWQKLVDDGISTEELDRAKTYLTGSYPLRFDGNQQIASILVGMQYGALPADYIETRNDLVEAVTVEKINAVMRDLFDPKELTFVVVGEPSGLNDE